MSSPESKIKPIIQPCIQPTIQHHASHYKARDFSDQFALAITKLLRGFADRFFAKRYGNRAIVLETVAAVPGMVGATLTHLRALRRMEDDGGWIRTLMDEAENERMHLMTFIAIAQPSWFERIMILFVQWIFYIGFFFLYLIAPKTAHRLVGYFEEEAVLSYTLYLEEIDAGRQINRPAPDVALHYWNLPAGTMLREVIEIIRADEAHHRDTNHFMADHLAGIKADTANISPAPKHIALDSRITVAPRQLANK